ncbi:unnamed protein product [Strongylus vulgaris]|uniref:Uncharacterized protein n=1 Tax=Strongylus vulgaris TaxID=40348 RepID=A0A3P7J3F5_STRVU|nr:unnamed protein product [Strongylus vulgaris]
MVIDVIVSGKDAFVLLESIRTCQFFVGGYFLCSTNGKESCLTSAADSKEVLSTETGSPLSSANEEGDRSYTEKLDSVHAETDSVELSDHEELKCMANSVVKEEVPGKPTSNSILASAVEASDGKLLSESFLLSRHDSNELGHR